MAHFSLSISYISFHPYFLPFGMCVCVCYCPPVFEVYPNYDEVIFQPRKLNTPDIDSITYCYIAYLLNLPHPLLLPSVVCPGGGSQLLTRFPSHQCPSCCLTVSPAHRFSMLVGTCCHQIYRHNNYQLKFPL